MTIVEAIAMGALQGVTEFLPVSSSGHLLLMKTILGATEIPVLFDVILHVATLTAVIFVFRRRVGALLGASFRFVRRTVRPEDRPNLRLIPILIAATAITAVLGIAIDSIDRFRNPLLVSVLFLVTAGLLIATYWARGGRRIEFLGYRDAIVLGIAQGFGVLPGISRSGITIATGLFSGMDRETAGEFSFLLSIPAILGALVLTLRDLGELGRQMSAVTVIAGFISAVVVGFLALRFLLRIVRGGKLFLFAVYLVPLGIWGVIQFS